ncbi:ionotropic receptor 75a-like [Temnothorax americanus]|uniref:ionotropic receptor 75a-like n=1 Tax=Temnothorax americanus TaxID=1964332 RepID=UPI00406958ED
MPHGSWKLLFLSRLLLVCANDNFMARDFFLYKDVSHVVGFSCGGLESDVKFARTFNEVFVLTSIWSLGSVNASSIRIIRKFLQNNNRNLGVYLDARCDGPNYNMIYAEAAKSSLFDDMHKWLILGRKLKDTVSLLHDDAFSVVTDITVAVETEAGFDLYDVYNPCKARGGTLNVTVLGYWTEKSGVAIRLKQPKYERRSNLHGMRLKVGVLLPRRFYNLSTEDIVLDQDMKAKYGRSQFLYTILLHMANLFNFTIEIVEVDPRKRQDNSAPMFVAFQKKTVDISASPIVMKAERLRSGDIIGPVWPMRSCFLFRTISSANMKTKQFLRPLNIKVWYVILSTIIIAASILVILIVKQEGIHSMSEGYNISILLTIGAISQQGSMFVPVHYAGRIAFIHIMLFSVLILNYYSASIVSDRLKNVGVKMNDSLISLADSNMKVAAEPTPYVRSFLQTPEKEVRYFNAKRWDKLPESKRYLPLAEGLDRVAKGGLAYHTSIESAYPYIERHFYPRMICELTEVHLFRAVLALWGRYKSPFTPLLRIGLTKIYDMGLRKRQLKFWSARRPFCSKNMLVAEPLSIQEATPIFLFISIAITLSLIICIMENFVYWIWPRLSASDANGLWKKLCFPTMTKTTPISRDVLSSE